MERIRLYNAKVSEGVVEIEQDGAFVPADDVLLLTAGAEDSEGFCFIGQSMALYFANTQPNLQQIIDKLVGAIDETINIANQMVVKVPSSPAVVLDAAAAAELETIKTEIEAIKLI